MALAATLVWAGAVCDAAPAKAQVKPWRGAPALFVHGQPVGPMAFRGGGEPGLTRRTYAAGIRVYLIWWRMAPPRVGFSGLDRAVRQMQDAAPDAYFILVPRFTPTKGFAAAHPDGTVRFNDGAADHFGSPVPKLRPAGVPRYSFASKAWRERAAAGLRALVQHVRQSDYDDRIVGYFIGAGHCGEWIWWCDFNHGRYALDYSPAMQAAFRAYLRAKYRGVARLQAAWRDERVTFESAAVPPLARRLRPSLGDFFDPAKDAPVRDYAEAHSAVVSDSILRLAREVKDADDGRSLVGLFYGSLQCTNYLWGGQADYLRVFDSPDIDFMASPFTYENRGVGDHAPFRSLLGSLRLRGKLWFAEADDRTSFAGPAQVRYGAPDNLPDSIEMLWRDFAHVAAANVQGWWTCFGPKWFDHPDILACFRRMQQLGQESLAWDRSTNGEVAVLIDRRSLLACESRLSVLCVDRARIHEWGRLGTMPDYFALEDAARPEVQRYKLYLLPNAFSLTTEQRRLVDRYLKRDGNVLVWYHAAGVINPDVSPAWSLQHCRELTGMRLGCVMKRAGAEMKLLPSGDPAVAGLPAGMQFGSFTRPVTSGPPGASPANPIHLPPVTLHPRFHVADADATPLARYTEGGQVGMAIKRFSDWTSVYIGTPAAPAAVLRALARAAGAHLYLDTDDVVYHSRSLLAVHTATAGRRTVRLPRRCNVLDARTGQPVATGVDHFDVDMPARRTFVYRLIATQATARP